MAVSRGVETRVSTNSDGQVPKWTKGADCKSVAIGFQGSNPCLPTKRSILDSKRTRVVAREQTLVETGSETGGRSSVVELQPSKLAVASSNLVARSKPNLFDPERFECARRDKATTASRAHVAQLAEHVLGKDEVTRSIRVVGSTIAPAHPGRAKTRPFPGLVRSGAFDIRDWIKLQVHYASYV